MWQPTDNYLAHSRGPWKRHKYTKIVNGHYIYDATTGKRYHTDNMSDAIYNKKQQYKSSQGLTSLSGNAGMEKRSRAQATATREQAKGKARTEREQKRLRNNYYSERSSKNYGDRLNAKRKELLSSHGSKGMDAARRVDEQMRMADRIYAKGKMREYEKAHGYDKAKTKGKNPTYKKNQRRAKLESLIFQGKRKVKKFLKNLKKRSEPKVTVTSNLMPAGTKKDITKKYNQMTSKKKKRR